MSELYDEALTIYKEIFNLLGDNGDWVNYNQTFRASSSIVANIAEGEGTNWGKQGYLLVRLINARGSLYETLTWLDIACIDKQAKQGEVDKIKDRLIKLNEVLTRLLKEVSDNRANLETPIITKKIANQEHWAEKAKERQRKKK